jgi:hypothetical protein
VAHEDVSDRRGLLFRWAATLGLDLRDFVLSGLRVFGDDELMSERGCSLFVVVERVVQVQGERSQAKWGKGGLSLALLSSSS